MAIDIVGAQRMLVVCNRAARGGAAELGDEVARVCRGLGCEPVLLSPQGKERAVAEISAEVADGRWAAIVAVGGDGTVRTVAEGIARGLGRLPMGPAGPTAGSGTGEAGGTGPALLVVPGGTGNSVYRALWEDRPWPEVVAEALTGRARVRHLDLLHIIGTGTVAMLGVTAGLIAETVRVSEGLVGASGRDLYSAAIITALGQHVPFPALVTVDGEVLHEGPTSLVAIGGARHRSGTFQLLPRSVLDDGLLDVCVIRGVDASEFIGLAGVVTAGEHIGRPEVAYAQGLSVTIERTDGAPLCVENDGDVRHDDEMKLTVEVLPAAVPTFAPLIPVAG